MKNAHKLRVLDLFSGIGGFSLGLERTGGFETVAFCEIDPFCRKVLAKHWPGVPIHEDVRKGDFVAADVITAGFPCQDISLAGDGAGLAGARSGLWREVVRAYRLVRPKHLLVENVAALLARGMGRVLGDLAESGADAEWDCLPTGFPYGHRRERVFVVAYPVRQGLSQRIDPDTTRPDEASFFTRERFARFLESAVPGEEWADRPLLGRGLSRIPDRAHRVTSLGNAVVPQIPELIGRAILEAT